MRSLQKEPQQVPPCRGVVTTINTVEAAGIEPASRDVSTRTSTRVVDSLFCLIPLNPYRRRFRQNDSEARFNLSSV